MVEEKKEKIVLSVYVSPKCKAKLECLQKLYAFAGTKFSLSKIVEDSIGYLYAGAYLCQKSKIWEGFFSVAQLLDNDATNKGVDEVIKIAKENKEIAESILNVPVNFGENVKKEIKKKFSK
jgi:hypothetical protein